MASTSDIQSLEKKSLEQPDETRTFDNGKVDVVTVGGVGVGRFTLRPGWRWSENVKPIVKTDSCQAPHLGYVLSGRMHVRMDDGTEEEFGPGDVVMVPPGHDAWVVGNEPYVALDITGSGVWAKQG